MSRSSNSSFTHGMSSMNCFVCGETIYGDGFEMNNHIDACLESRERSVATHSTYGTVNQTSNSDGQLVDTERLIIRLPRQNESIESIINSTSSPNTHLYTSHQYDELDSSALLALTSNPSANSSTGHLSSNPSLAADSDIELDIDIDGDEETTLKPTFGENQFSEKDILKFDQTGNGLRELIAGIDDEGEIVVDDASSPLKSDFFVDIETPGTNVDKSEKPDWTVSALKERIKELERSSTSSHNCQICFSPYSNPVTSILCWHVYCEDCWLQSLACKKLCPSCTNVTGACDLRRIYL
ncbi:hypothetical protein BKA69DRAFT_185757 [Paraphysoderma sedebokerense]|nr:hypothetical protein BKA69DRAFT_185757 [Paraphysoderma sedebokerense]